MWSHFRAVLVPLILHDFLAKMACADAGFGRAGVGLPQRHDDSLRPIGAEAEMERAHKCPAMQGEIAMNAAAAVPLSGLSAPEHRAQLRRAVIASTVGTTIEWYDFLLYGTVTALVFGKLFFPKSDPIVGVLEAFSVFFIGFVGRPIGAFIFGHWGDRIGRKATLIVTLLVTGVATVAVGCVPGYNTIGIWGAVLLTFIRLVQGIGVGGEWGGSVLLAMEWAQTNKNRGFLSAWPQFGAPAGLFLANCAVLFFSWYSGDQFLVWGWRIPFFLSASWSPSACGSGWASWRRRCSSGSSTRSASSACRCWRC